MPVGTRRRGLSEVESDVDSAEELNATIREQETVAASSGEPLSALTTPPLPAPLLPVATTSIEARLNEMMNQLHDLREEMSKSHQPLRENEQHRDEIRHPSRPPVVNRGEEESTSLAAVLGQLSQTLSSSRAEHTTQRKLYDLPEFDGSPEQWPMFKEAFTMTTEEYFYNDRQNMMRLQKAIKGKAREAVECLLIHSSNVQRTMNTLEERFGQPEQLVKSQIHRVRQLAPIPERRMDLLLPFATKVQNLSSFLEAAQCDHYLSNPTLMDELLLKLPMERRMDWGRHAVTIKPRPNVRHFSDWLQNLAKMANAACVIPSEENRQVNARDSARGRLFHVNEFGIAVATSAQQGDRCKMCQGAHNMSTCRRFLDMDVRQRWRIVRQRRLCFNCLLVDHRSSECRQQHHCHVRDCPKKIHELLHETNLPSNDSYVEPENDYGTTQQMFTSTVEDPSHRKLLFKILPVKLYATGKVVRCFAFFDEGSSVTLINDNLVEQLGLKGNKENLTLQWFGNTCTTEPSSRVNMQISGEGSHCRKFSLKNVRTVKDLRLPSQTLNIEDLHLKYRHRRQLPIQNYNQVTPGLLIGLDNAHLGVARRVVADGWKGPAVVLTKLGWVVYGADKNHELMQNHYAYFTQASNTSMDHLEKIVNDYVTNENLGVRDVEHVESSRDTRARLILEHTTSRIGDRFQTGLLWREDNTVLPPSRGLAERRFLALENKFRRDDNYHREYCRIMADYEKKGYSRKLSVAEALTRGPRTWYLPHFGTCNPNKPDKLRLVFDAAAKANNISLNSALLSGPDQNTDLITILMKFRQKPVGVCADIVEMFHQVRIIREDQDAQRFLWRTDRSEPIREYVMNVMTFGSTCSPCSAQYVKDRNAMQFLGQFPAAVDAILNNHYVDDFVHSFANVNEAIKVSEEVAWIHKQGGFELKRFISNSKLLNERFNENQQAASMINLERGATGTYQKVLGMHWDTSRDILKFLMAFGKVDPRLLKGSRRPTKRETLSITMSVFDPFGLAAEYSLIAKVLLQTVWSNQTGWDEIISDDAYALWIKWLNKLKDLEDISIPRCYGATIFTSSLELHIFADASEKAYAAVGYWRISEKKAGAKLAFVMGKTKCAPLKLTSIPRLELQSAVLATRLRQLILQNHNIKPVKVTMWTDSRTVLAWINSDHRRYKPYVTHRINEILESSNGNEWRWVPSAMNPADFGTRLMDGKRESFWVSGPKFLEDEESEWPSGKPPTATDEELRTKCTVLLIESSNDVFKRFSSFDKLKRVVGWILRFRTNCFKAPYDRDHDWLKASELEYAELVVCRSLQMVEFAEEYKALCSGGQVGKSSKLRKLNPSLNEFRLICVNGRIDQAIVAAPHTQRPIVLPKDHHVTYLIVNYFHCLANHQNEDTVIAEIRRRYWITHIRSVVRKNARNCRICKLRTAKPTTPMMGQLPEDRLTPFVRPFTYTGMDYMGPFFVVNGRNSEKRWIVLFTCLTTRAIHLEIARDLSTDTCLLCIRNFTSRRGTPIRIRSDNGSNFIGADRELKRQLKEFNQKKIADALASRKIEWVFNCPLNPHAGGCWERLVRSVKRAMGHALYNERLQEHSLYSLMCEAENLVNSRPLTHIPLDTPTDEPLTPNHFLIGTSNSEQTPHPHEEGLIVTRKQWRKVQHIQYRFWKKWLAEYLPDLCRRTKWYQQVTPLEVGDLVLVCDSSIHRSKWPMGRVSKVFPGRDEQVRTAEVRTSSGTFKRPACMLAKLDVGESDEL